MICEDVIFNTNVWLETLYMSCKQPNMDKHRQIGIQNLKLLKIVITNTYLTVLDPVSEI